MVDIAKWRSDESLVCNNQTSFKPDSAIIMDKPEMGIFSKFAVASIRTNGNKSNWLCHLVG